MNRVLLTATTVVALATLAGCAAAEERVAGVRADAEQLTDEARFCLALARVTTAIESGSPRTAAEAAEEAFAQAPESIRDRAAAVVDAVREDDASALDDPEVVAAAEDLEDAARQVCDPTS